MLSTSIFMNMLLPTDNRKQQDIDFVSSLCCSGVCLLLE